MRLLTYRHNGEARFGLERPDGIVDVNAADPTLPASLHAYLADADNLRPQLERLAHNGAGNGALIDPASVTLLPPIAAPQKIICIGLNYRDHAAEIGQELPTHPAAFAKYANTLVGHGGAIVLPPAQQSTKVDYEGELAFVIGKRARNVPREHAYDYIAGYTIVNDVSVRDFQMRTSQWMLGKVFDTHAPCGPVIVTADEIPDPQALHIRTSIDGETLQDSSTANLIFDVPALVAELSSIMTLEPGDIVSTGTPAGVGVSRSPQRFMRAGERIRIEIERIGALENPIVAG